MAKTKNDLYLFEALELRNTYDRHISVIKGILEHDTTDREYFSRSSGNETKEYDEEFDYKHFERSYPFGKSCHYGQIQRRNIV